MKPLLSASSNSGDSKLSAMMRKNQRAMTAMLPAPTMAAAPPEPLQPLPELADPAALSPDGPSAVEEPDSVASPGPQAQGAEPAAATGASDNLSEVWNSVSALQEMISEMGSEVQK